MPQSVWFTLVLIVCGACSAVSFKLLYIRPYVFTSMISLLRWSAHRLQLAVLLVFLGSVVIIISIYPSVIFISVVNTDHVSRKKPFLGVMSGSHFC